MGRFAFRVLLQKGAAYFTFAIGLNVKAGKQQVGRIIDRTGLDLAEAQQTRGGLIACRQFFELQGALQRHHRSVGFARLLVEFAEQEEGGFIEWFADDPCLESFNGLAGGAVVEHIIQDRPQCLQWYVWIHAAGLGAAVGGGGVAEGHILKWLESQELGRLGCG